MGESSYQNAFIKTDSRLSLDSSVTETFDNIELLNTFNNLKIIATQQDINKFVATDEMMKKVICSQKKY